MATKMQASFIPREVPLCLEHFLSFAEKYHASREPLASQFEPLNLSQDDSSSGCSCNESSNTPSPRQPTRVQPKRQAKRKYVEAKMMAERNSKKRKLSSDTSERKNKKRRCCNANNEQSVQTANEALPPWPQAIIQLQDMIYKAVHHNAETRTCLSGADVWTCQECKLERAREVAGLRAGWDAVWAVPGRKKAPIADMQPIGEVFPKAPYASMDPIGKAPYATMDHVDEIYNLLGLKAPVASMEPTGEFLYVSCSGPLEVREEDKVQWAGLTFVVESCITPMILIV
ncbi:hypothetical protein B0T10DRAFT_456457 [Thelonectria olida]|uniref:Uncharacterized protein n=1 Tax=Thelonectria olida TaxID=1576542 RepID=A0A9P8WAY8_9HYPO|nr:hypothetical protein B0T10DRAFT_456457 [Thelonectria olida]